MKLNNFISDRKDKCHLVYSVAAIICSSIPQDNTLNSTDSFVCFTLSYFKRF